MARPLRIEYPGAAYHVMARGNQGRALFKDDKDRLRFLETLGQACEKTGWRIHAYVLMGNHYHLLLETPEANLVAGMKWLQGTYTQRFNSRHEICGHLFQGRYKAAPVDSSNAGYFETASTYIHLNPARSGLIEVGKEKLKSYRWSSYPAYLTLPHRSPGWLEHRQVMGALRLKPEDRRGYETYLESRALELGLKAGRAELEEQWKALRRGWFVGEEKFGAKLRDKMEALLAGLHRESHSGAAKHEHGEQAAEQRLALGLKALGLTEEKLAKSPKVSAEKAALAQWLREKTAVSLRWIAGRLKMGHYTNAGRDPRKMSVETLRKLKKARAELQKLEGGTK